MSQTYGHRSANPDRRSGVTHFFSRVKGRASTPHAFACQMIGRHLPCSRQFDVCPVRAGRAPGLIEVALDLSPLTCAPLSFGVRLLGTDFLLFSASIGGENNCAVQDPSQQNGFKARVLMGGGRQCEDQFISVQPGEGVAWSFAQHRGRVRKIAVGFRGQIVGISLRNLGDSKLHLRTIRTRKTPLLTEPIAPTRPDERCLIFGKSV